MTLPDPAFWRGRKVLVTGHTGFKGSWLALVLADLGALVHGYALAPAAGASGERPLYELAGLDQLMSSSLTADLRDRQRFFDYYSEVSPSVVFHLAAQPLVRESYRQPLATFEVNALGTATVLEALRLAARPVTCVLITTDKCYENPEDGLARLEDDRLGGRDPYSASKAAAELAAIAWRRSFFESDSSIRVATARAGNVIGGGDRAADRLLPDLARAFAKGEIAVIRSPASVRPWQHVLEPLFGYLALAERLSTAADPGPLAAALNFGPDPGRTITVAEVASLMAAAWGPEAKWRDASEPGAPHEAAFLSLDSSKAKRLLGWRPRWDASEAVRRTALWYRAAEAPGFDALAACRSDLADYLKTIDEDGS